MILRRTAELNCPAWLLHNSTRLLILGRYGRSRICSPALQLPWTNHSAIVQLSETSKSTAGAHVPRIAARSNVSWGLAPEKGLCPVKTRIVHAVEVLLLCGRLCIGAGCRAGEALLWTLKNLHKASSWLYEQPGVAENSAFRYAYHTKQKPLQRKLGR